MTPLPQAAASLRIPGRGVYTLDIYGEWQGANDETLSELRSMFRPEFYPQSLDVWPQGRVAVNAAAAYFGGIASFPEKPEIPKGAVS